MHCLFEQPDGSFQTLIRPELIEDPVIEWAYRTYVKKLNYITEKLQNIGIPIYRGNARYPQL